MRLQKILAEAGIASRRGAEALIGEGRVSVNGQVVTEMGVRVDPAVDRVEVDGKAISVGQPDLEQSSQVYILLNKPTGAVSTVTDPFGRATVLDVPAEEIRSRNLRLYPVGRLDAGTTGLLLLTNDGELTYRLTHPSYGVEKEYEALVRGRPDEEALLSLSEGVVIDGKRTSPAHIQVLERRGGDTRLRIVIHEGRKRQVRLMAAAVGHPIVELRRVRFGPLHLGDLQPGAWRHLSTDEVRALREAVGLG